MTELSSNQVSKVRDCAAEVARVSYGKLLSILSAQSGDIVASEDALGDAFRLALEKWPTQGIPINPEGWLITTARNRRIDAHRRSARAPAVSLDDHLDLCEPERAVEVPDKRLSLLFVCAHPAIDRGVHTPLMLQTVLGFEASEIARSFLVSSSAMAQRLVRAKKKIKDAKIPFGIPDSDDMPARLEAVLEAIYGAYSLGWMDQVDTKDMKGEALYLSRLVAELMPNEPEASGLASLIGFAHARAKARLLHGAYVPVEEQDCELWDHSLIVESESRLRQAAAKNQFGRFQLEAAIQSVYARRAVTGEMDWRAILHLTEGLCRFWPTAGALVSRAAIVGEIFGAEAGLNALGAIPQQEIRRFQPAHATRAHLLMQSGQRKEAVLAFDQAITLTTELPLRRWLESRRDEVVRMSS